MSFVLNGPNDGGAIVAYIEQFVAPALHPSDVVVMDNCPAHNDGLRVAIQPVATIVLYLAAYISDLNPTEKIFAKSKAVLRNAADELGKMRIFRDVHRSQRHCQSIHASLSVSVNDRSGHAALRLPNTACRIC